MKFIDFLSLKKYDVISLTGCCGKTTLLNKICLELLNQLEANEKILMTTTTKIKIPTELSNNEIYFSSFQNVNVKDPHPIHIFGNSNNGEKILGLCEEELEYLYPHYTYIVNEADGSKGFPFKAWRAFEPVIPKKNTKTIGILPYLSWNEPVSDKNVFQKELFLQNFCTKTQQLDFSTMNNILTSPQGLFKFSQGVNILYINHVENEAHRKEVEQFIHFTTFKGEKIIVGSTPKEEYYEYCRNCHGKWVLQSNEGEQTQTKN